MKYLALYLLTVICMMSLSSLGQNRLSDSLRSAIDNPASDEKEKPALLIQLAEIYRGRKNYSIAEIKARQSAAISLKYKNYTEVTKAYALLASIASSLQQLKRLKSIADSTLAFASKANDPVALAEAYNAQIQLYKTLGDQEAVVKFGNLGLKQLAKKPDSHIAAKIYYRLYVVHSHWNNEAKVNFYAHEATKNALLTKDYNLLSNCYTALSVAHEYNYNTTKKKAELDSVLFYLHQAEVLYRQYPEQVNDYTYAIACVNIADYYLKYFPEYDNGAKIQAIRYANMANAVLRNTINSQEVIASSLGILSEYAKREGNDALSESYLLEAYKVMKTEQPPYYYTMINVVQALSQFYEQRGNYKKAISFQKEVTQYNNENFNQKQALNAQKLEIQYETEKKDAEMRILKEREQSRRMQNYLYGCIAVASLLGLLFMFRAYHFKLRYSLQREKQLQLEKQDSELQIKLEKEEQARLKVEQQLLETQQQQLKTEVMANVLQLEHKNQMLINIRDKLTGGDPVNMQKILREEMVLDNDFERAKMQIQQVHPDFFNLINDKAQKKLTVLDLKLCAYLYLKMDTRQIAQLMNIEAKSVRMSRYRIKQKLGLEKDDDLYIFLQGLAS
jgi:DNA-binding CsgD family transcriptional regulator